MTPRSVARVPTEPPAPASVLPAVRELLSTSGPFLFPLLALLASRIAAWVAFPSAAEDAYITFRFARNLAAGNGLVYNPAEHVLGFSSPLWTVWVGLGFLLRVDPLVWTRTWSTAADVVTLVCVGHALSRHVSRRAALAFTAFFAALPYIAIVCVSGLEMSAQLALLALAAALVERRSIAAGPVLALAALTRPEGFACAALIACFAQPRDRLIAAGLVATGLAALFARYGTVVPHSVLAKAAVYGTHGPVPGRVWWDWLVPVLIPGPGLSDVVHLMMMRLVLFPAAVVGVIRLWPCRGTAPFTLAAALLGVWLGYALLGVAFFWWYLLLPLVGIALAASVGLTEIVRGRWIPVCAALLVATSWTQALPFYRGRAQAEALSFGSVGEFLAANAHPGETVLLEPIGRIGYAVPLHVIDEVGLVTPEVAQRRREGSGWYTDVVQHHSPEWLVVRRGMLRTGEAFAGTGSPFRTPAERDSLMARYATEFTAEDGTDAALLVLRRTR